MTDETLIQYQSFRFRQETLDVIETANEIIRAYRVQGFDLTLRQLYYQFVARDLIPNKEREYKKLGDIISNGRLAGLIDWQAIQDRTRSPRTNATWDSPSDLIAEDVDVFGIDKWEPQTHYVEVWIEKDALVGVLDSVCPRLDVTYFSCRGYTSQSAMWRASVRLHQKMRDGKTPIILHLGDHDPSGIDMTRDIEDRLKMFLVRDLEVHRIALNMDQIEQYNPPPNPAKMTDSRFESYRDEHGDESWELDALEPSVLAALIEEHVSRFRDDELWESACETEEELRKQLRDVSERWEDVIDFLREG